MNSLLVYRYRIITIANKISWLWLLVLFFIAGCTSPTQDNKQTLIIFAASSLTDAFNELSHDFEEQNSDTDIQLQYAGSSQLTIQISQGAPADIFASANQKQIDVVLQEGLNKGEALIFAQNELVLIVPVDNPANIRQFAELKQNNLRIITAIEGVPIRDYTDLIMSNLAQDQNYGVEFTDQFYANIRSEETNVRQIVLKTALGEADAAIVYRTDVTAEVQDELIVIEVPESYSPQPVYYIVVLENGKNTAKAQAFMDYILSEMGQKTLQKYGFWGATSSVASATTSPAP